MAISLVQKQTATSAGAVSLAPTLDVGATAGNLLIVVAATDASSGVWTEPSGFNVVNSVSGTAISGILCWDVATGGETSKTISWNNNRNCRAWIIEYSGLDPTSPFDVAAENEDNVAAATTSQTSGTTAATSVAESLAFAFMCADVSSNVDAGQSWTNSFTAQEAFPTSTRCGIAFAHKILSATGAQETTFATTDTGDEMYGLIAVFKTTVAGGLGIPIAAYHYNHHLGSMT